MPHVLEAPEIEVLDYHEVEPEKPAAKRSRLSGILGFLRSVLRSRRVSGTVRHNQFETCMEMLARTDPFIFIGVISG
jgi:hypothetical protein